MKRDSLDILAASAVPISGISIASGGWVLNLAPDGAATSEAKFTAAFAPAAGANAEADVFWSHAGTWRTDGDNLVLEMTQTEAAITQARTNGFSAPGGPLPPVDALQGGPYECTADTLTVATTNGTQALEMLLER
jgi:hypothetical protein